VTRGWFVDDVPAALCVHRPLVSPLLVAHDQAYAAMAALRPVAPCGSR